MIRTKKGYFYNEFISKKFVALAWNLIDSATDFSVSNIETIKDTILVNYAEIKRPTTVINKCKSFINDVKEGDYIVIPSSGSELITIAIANEYYEENSKTYEIEQEVISRIESDTVSINDVSCPYKKRRKIISLLTVKASQIDGKLFKAISNYHGISNLDDYWRNILGLLYDTYSYKNNFNIVYHINRIEPVGPRQLSKLLLSATECWCQCIDDENKLSAQVNVCSPGPVDFLITEVLPAFINNAEILAGLTIGVISSVKPDTIPGLIKNIFSLPAIINREYIATQREQLELKKQQDTVNLEIEEKKLNNLEKKIEILERLSRLDIDTKKLEASAITLSETFDYLKIDSAEQRKNKIKEVEIEEKDELSCEEVAEEEKK